MESKSCFVIAPIGEPDSDVRIRSDLIQEYVIRPAVEECGYSPIRADQLREPGIITTQVIQHIANDPLVIADLTGRNPNVFYELAVRHALRKPLIHIIRKGEDIPFDLAGMRTVDVDHHDLRSVAEAKQAIIETIEVLEANPSSIDTPISSALDLLNLKKSEDPEQRSLGDVLSRMTDLSAIIARLESNTEALTERVQLGGTIVAKDPEGYRESRGVVIFLSQLYVQLHKRVSEKADETALFQVLYNMHRPIHQLVSKRLGADDGKYAILRKLDDLSFPPDLQPEYLEYMQEMQEVRPKE